MQLGITQFLRDHLTGDPTIRGVAEDAVVIPVDSRGSLAVTRRGIDDAFDEAERAQRAATVRRPNQRATPRVRPATAHRERSRETASDGLTALASTMAGVVLGIGITALTRGGGQLRALAMATVATLRDRARDLVHAATDRAARLFSAVSDAIGRAGTATLSGVAELWHHHRDRDREVQDRATVGADHLRDQAARHPLHVDEPHPNEAVAEPPSDARSALRSSILRFWSRSVATVRAWLMRLFGDPDDPPSATAAGSGASGAATAGGGTGVVGGGLGRLHGTGSTGASPGGGTTGSGGNGHGFVAVPDPGGRAVLPSGSGVDARWTPGSAEAIRLAAVDRLVKVHGQSVVTAAAAVGGYGRESFNNPLDNTGDGGLAHGIGQWHPDRWRPFLEYARITGKNPNLRSTQLDYGAHESGLTNDPASLNMTPQQKAATGFRSSVGLIGRANRAAVTGDDPYRAGSGWVHGYERSAASVREREADEAGRDAQRLTNEYRRLPHEHPADAARPTDAPVPPSTTAHDPPVPVSRRDEQSSSEKVAVVDETDAHRRERLHPRHVHDAGVGLLVIGTHYA